MTQPPRDRWLRVESLYHAAASRPESQRRAFVADACGGDEDLRREVESLLAQSPSGFLEQRAFVAVSAGPETVTLVNDGDPRVRMGARFGGYEIVGILGAGGMGEVYEAHDARLGRAVALKILPSAFTRDPDRLARFEREARVLAALNHPNIAAIYEFEEDGAGEQHARALVLELVDGETLSDIIARGPLRVPEVIRIAGQIVDALDAAHERGIVHRDLKPANIKLTSEGVIKVLDFGLATMAPPSGVSKTGSPTRERTDPGVILGTVPYMSPEQARGQMVDKRTDVWAFGCVLFEMLTGRRAFAGETASDTIARILEREVDWNALPPATPSSLRRVLARTLVKDPKRRIRDIGDVRVELEEDPAAVLPGQARRPEGWWKVAAITAALTAAASAAAFLGVRAFTTATPAAAPALRLSLALGSGESFPRDIAVSPNGAYVAYNAGPPGDHKTYLRALGERQSRVISELPSDQALSFFSPDSQWLAFFDAGKLKKVSMHGGSPVTLVDAPVPRGGAWGEDGSIVFAPAARSGLLWLPPGATAPQTLTTPDESRGETSHRQPSFLPHSRTVVYVAEGDSYGERALVAVSLDRRQPHMILQANAQHPQFVPTGHLLYLERDTILAAPFDLKTEQLSGPPAAILEGVGSYGTSLSGLLVYGETDSTSAQHAPSTMVWVGRDGTIDPLPQPAKRYSQPRVSPDGRRIVTAILDGTDRSLWVLDLARHTPSRLTFDASNGWPQWTPDGARIVYASNRSGTQWDVLIKRADGSGAEEPIVRRVLTQIPRAISPAGDRVIFTETDPLRGDTLWTVSIDEKSEARPLFDGVPGEMMPTFSPDGRWIAYVFPESGRYEVFVRSTNGRAGKWQVSSGGGVEPIWSRDGRELFYRNGDKMVAVTVETAPTFAAGKSQVLFEGSFIFGTNEEQEYDVSPDGKRFLMLKPSDDSRRSMPLDVVVNWFDDLRGRIPANK